MKLTKRELAIVVPIIVILVTLPLYAIGYITSLLVTILMYATLAMSWNILSGYTGYISLGTAAFFGIGVYIAVAGWLSGLPYPLIIILGGLAGMIFAAAVGYPCLRIRGPYFVILTFGLAEALKFIVEQIQVGREYFSYALVGAPTTVTFYYSLLIIAILIVATDHIIRNSKFGFGLSSIRGNEEAAEAVGVDTTNYKLLAFIISALFIGSVGVVMALRWAFILPDTAFNPMISFQTMIMAILGGSKDFRGPLLGAVILTIISEIFKTNFPPGYYMVLLGITLILVVKFVPGGLLGAISRWHFKKRKG
jgi:branched-chain amino acid transport system permease protein